MIIVLMLAGGKAVEDFAQGRAIRELSPPLEREPQIAHRLVSGPSSVDDVEVGDVVIGELILIRAGPRTRREGEPILSGSVNGNSSAIIMATALA